MIWMSMLGCGGERPDVQYAYRYDELEDGVRSSYIQVVEGGAQHWPNQFSVTGDALEPFQPPGRTFAYTADRDDDGVFEVFESSEPTDDGGWWFYGDRDDDGVTDYTALLDERFLFVRRMTPSADERFLHDDAGRLLEYSWTSYDLTPLPVHQAIEVYSYEGDSRDWVTFTFSGALTYGRPPQDQRRDLDSRGRWIRHHRADYEQYVGFGEEYLLHERAYDDQDRETSLVTRDATGEIVYTRETTYEGAWAARRRIVDQGVTSVTTWSFDEDGIPVTRRTDTEGEITFTTIGRRFDDLGRETWREEITDGEVTRWIERTDLGRADEVDLNPWDVPARGFDAYGLPAEP